ncbi:MAG: hypothetical protein R3D02_14420 [Hyphomicrobiales bacterium]
MSETSDKAGTRPADARKARLAEALRENLKRRKAQARARDDHSASTPEAPDAAETKD